MADDGDEISEEDYSNEGNMESKSKEKWKKKYTKTDLKLICREEHGEKF